MNDVATATAPAPAATAAACPICKQSHDGTMAKIVRRIGETPARLRKLVKGLDAKGLASSYGPGKWSIRQLVCHLRDCELVYGVRWRLILSESQPPLQPFDQDHWASELRYAKQDVTTALATFEQLREGNLELLKLGSAAAFARVGRHPEYGTLTLEQMVRHLLAHDEKHLGHVELARAARKAKKTRKPARN